MAFRKNNIDWMLAYNPGRPRKIESAEELWRLFCEYVKQAKRAPWYKNDVKTEDKALVDVSIPTERPLSLAAFCCFLGVHETFLKNNEIAKKGDDYAKEFSPVVQQIKMIVETQQLEGATVGAYNSNIVARKLGLTDKQEVTARVIEVEQPDPDEE